MGCTDSSWWSRGAPFSLNCFGSFRPYRWINNNKNLENTVQSEFIRESVKRLRENTPKIGKCLDEMSDADVWQRPNPSCNSVGTIIVHLCGNITQYIISSLGGTEDRRERDKEFATRGGLTKTELFNKLNATVEQAVGIIENIQPGDMLTKKSVQGFDLSAIGIVIHVVEHYSYHTGQIIYWTKMLKDKDLEFYKNIDLNRKNIP